MILIDFSLTVKAVTLIFTSGRGSAISSAKQGKSGSIYNLVKSNFGVSKIDYNRCKLALASLPVFVHTDSLSFTVILNLQQKTAYARGSENVIFTCVYEI